MSRRSAYRPVGMSEMSTSSLLGTFADILDELRARDVVRSSNNPVADYAESLTCRAFGLQQAPKVAKGFDAIDARTGVRYQVKSRRLTEFNRSRQLGFFRSMDATDSPFDVLIGILFDRDFAVRRAAAVPFTTVLAQVAPVEYVGGWRFMLRDEVWNLAGVTDVTEQIRGAARALDAHA